MQCLMKTVLEKSYPKSLGNEDGPSPTHSTGNIVMDQVAHENDMEVVLDQTSVLWTYINKRLEKNGLLDEHDAIELDTARTSGNVEQIEMLNPAVKGLEGTNEQLVLAYWDWITVGNNDENMIKGQP